jgi:hypothetical protein
MHAPRNRGRRGCMPLGTEVLEGVHAPWNRGRRGRMLLETEVEARCRRDSVKGNACP